MREKGLRATGCNSAIRSINAYLHWASPTGLQPCGAGCTHLKIHQMEDPRLELPTFDSKKALLLLQWKPKTKPDCRLSTLIALLADVGARIDEALSLKWADVDFDNLLVLLHGIFVFGLFSTIHDPETRTSAHVVTPVTNDRSRT